MKLSKKHLEVLKRYENTSDSNFLQGGPEAADLWYKFKLLDWHGQQYGTHFYSITPAGMAALIANDKGDI